ncbi:MAG: ATP-dependent helicase [Thermoplasmatales archaeon]|nr:ATP-dependent helicase [Thermoplasmatales archaeon]
MNITELERALENMPDRNFRLDNNQKEVIRHGAGPLWVIAGPGSGKTDSIVFRCIKLLVVDKTPPASIVLTTFTEKAANNLQSRISQYMQYLITIESDLRSIDYNRVRVGTLHGLCNDIMQEFRFTGYQNYRLLDEMEQKLFIMEHSSAASVDETVYQDYDQIWRGLPFEFNGFDYLTERKWSISSPSAPNRHMRAKGLLTLFNRIVEDQLDTEVMRTVDGIWEALTKAYEEYRNLLLGNYRCDFAHVQAKFLEFLGSSQAGLFLKGNGTDQYPGIRYVLVDEYQDTNPIQEEIYFRLTYSTQNLCVVGDDDQALYRFRGGTVDSMVNFENVCSSKWTGVAVKRIFLSTNYRSHPEITSFYDGYIRSFEEMNLQGARVQGKPRLSHGSTIRGNFPAVAIRRGKTANEVAKFFVGFVRWLKDNGKIDDYSQCALLLPSTKRSRNNAGPFMDEMEAQGLPYYNPRSRSLLREDEVMIVLGGLLEIVDPDASAQSTIRFPAIQEISRDWRSAFDRTASSNVELRQYIDQYAESIRRKGPSASVGVNLLEIFYDLLNYFPLLQWIDDPERSTHLGVISKVLDAYSNVPVADNHKVMLGSLYTSSAPNQGISFTWRKKFYYSLIGLLANEGLNEAEDEIETVQRGRIPIMTIHQSKGLEFPIVFVYGLSSRKEDNAAVELENSFLRFRRNQPAILPPFSTNQKAKQDIIRLFYVAYSRAQYALILLARSSEYRNPGIGFGGSSNWSVFQHAREIRE